MNSFDFMDCFVVNLPAVGFPPSSSLTHARLDKSVVANTFPSVRLSPAHVLVELRDFLLFVSHLLTHILHFLSKPSFMMPRDAAPWGTVLRVSSSGRARVLNLGWPDRIV